MSGVRQGGVFTPILFNAMMDGIVHKVRRVKRTLDMEI
jgi:hypothetical protein